LAWRLAEETLALLRSDLAGAEAMLPFASSVVAQLARGADAADEGATARRVAAVVRSAASGPLEVAAADLCADPPLFAAFFQNLDLLFAAPVPEADAVSGLVMAALERAAESGAP
jgi:hypothetical protein